MKKKLTFFLIIGVFFAVSCSRTHEVYFKVSGNAPCDTFISWDYSNTLDDAWSADPATLPWQSATFNLGDGTFVDVSACPDSTCKGITCTTYPLTVQIYVDGRAWNSNNSAGCNDSVKGNIP